MSSKGFSKVGAILQDFTKDEDKYISREFQKYGYELAKELGDLKSKSLYIKLAKETPRGLLENARNFVKDAMNVKSPAKLFMWKLSELKKRGKLTHKRSAGASRKASTRTLMGKFPAQAGIKNKK
jgi:hypothetical protein